MSNQILAPFTDDQITSLNEYQASGVFHPFTCGGSIECRTNLIATKEGWTCPNCNYTQEWAWDWMANNRWRGMELTSRVDQT